ncbi:MAG TPA: HDOD domain-containing protein [Bryobacteraceae bacterium]|nr:HDOD domain-containing protein [Bryobacteraceae bacterium]
MLATANNLSAILAASKLPAFSGVAVRLMQVLSQDDASFQEVCDLLQTDAALSTEVLRLANSPLFCISSEVKTIALALATLGLDRLNLLVATTALWRSVPGSLSRQLVRTWWRHNLTCALLCDQLPVTRGAADYRYISGLLHSVGQLALIGTYPAEYSEVHDRAARRQQNLLDEERLVFGVDHCVLGEALLLEWGIPREVADCAAHHHDPENAQTPFSGLVYTACRTANQWGFAALVHHRLPDDALSPNVRALARDQALCSSITEKVTSIESHLL